MATSNPNSSDRRQHSTKPVSVPKDPDLIEDETVVDDDVSNFFDEEEAEPGDRRRDPLRR